MKAQTQREKQPTERESDKEQGSKEENKKRVKAERKKEEGRERERWVGTGGEAGGEDQGRKVRHVTTRQRGDSINSD